MPSPAAVPLPICVPSDKILTVAPATEVPVNVGSVTFVMSSLLDSLFIGFTNPPYVMLLFTTSMGNKIFASAVIMWVLGFLWMRRMSRVAI